MTTYPDDDEILIKPLRVKATPPAGDRLEVIRARLASATPAPWTTRRMLGFSDIVNMDMLVEVCSEPHDPANSALIANAPSDLEFLLSEVDRLREQLCDGLWQHERRMTDDGWCSYCETGERPDC